ncbi:MAG: cardiolipin synthase [Tissierellia bacterium]|nr:cardiolipin synthase [Tissierellia bacterium]
MLGIKLSHILASLLWLNIILAILVVVGERRNPKSTWMWIMTLVFLPGIGFLLYLWLGRDFRKQKLFSDKTAKDKLKATAIERLKQQLDSGSFVEEKETPQYIADLIRMHLLNSDSVLTKDNRFSPIFSGEENFKCLLEDIRNARRFIYFQTYIMRCDRIGNQLIDLLLQKKREGLDVKLLIDGMGGRGLRKKAIKRLREGGVETEIFFPFFIPYVSPRMNYRNHRKICVIDGEKGYIGGFNVGDEYIDGGKDFASWRDAALIIEGSAVRDLQLRFEMDFNFAAGGKRVEFQSIPNASFEGKGLCQVVTSGPDSYWPSIRDGYAKMIMAAKKRIFIETPYFIPDDSILESLKIASLSGVDVRIMLPFKGDHPFVFWASLSFAGELMRAGCKCYLYQKGFQHAKVMIMDDTVVSVGTANMDVRSFSLNFEANAFVYDKETTQKFAQRFLQDLQDSCTEVTPEVYQKRGKRAKIKESISRLFAPLL